MGSGRCCAREKFWMAAARGQARSPRPPWAVRALETIKVDEFEAVIREITGSAWITSIAPHVIDPDEPYRYGI